MIILGVLVDQFQPPHVGHKKAYDLICKERHPEYSFIVASNKNFHGFDPYYPLSFNDKEQVLIKHNIPKDKIVKGNGLFDTSPFMRNFDEDDVAIVYYFFKSLGESLTQSSGFQPWNDNDSNGALPISKCVYYKILPESLLDIKGVKFNTVNFITELGNPSNSDDNKKTFFALSMGWYDAGFFNLFKDRFSKAYTQYASQNVNSSAEDLGRKISEDMMTAISSDPKNSSQGKEDEPSRDDDLKKIKSFERGLNLWKSKTRSESELNKRKERDLEKLRTSAKHAVSIGQSVPQLPSSL